MERERNKIVLLGSGNVGTQLARALDPVAEVIQIWSRNYSHAEEAAEKLSNARPISDIEEIDTTADFYIIAVADDAVADVASRLKGVSEIVCHTSGTVPLEDISKVLPDTSCGVFYPLQTFSKQRAPDISTVPFLIEGNDPFTTDKLKNLAGKISERVYCADSDLRSHIHVAAVFANNFTNLMWTLADEYLKAHSDLDFSIFEPLLRETLDKAIEIGPKNAQTGPAKRNDSRTIQKHLEKLNSREAEIYKMLTEAIMDQNGPQ